MKQINSWMQRVNKDKLEMKDKMVIANATMEMLEKLEPIYDKYNGNSCDVAIKSVIKKRRL